MLTPTFAETHNLVAFSEKPSESKGLEKIIDFLNATPIRYALTMNPTVYASCVKQFWTTAKVKKVNNQEQIQALVDKQKVIIMEESIRRDLKFNDTEGTACLPNDTIFAKLARIGGEDNIQLNELMIFCTSLQQQVLDLEEAKIAQVKEIAKLKKRVNKLEKRRKSRPAWMRRLKKVGTSKQVESSGEQDSLGAQEDASKQGRNIEDIDQDAEIALVDESQGRITANPVTTAGEVVTAASVKDSVAPTTATTADVDDELTLAKTLIAIKKAKPKVKGKEKTIEPEIPLKKKDQIALDEEVARKLEAEMRAELEEEERIAREKDEANRVVIEE
nr:hypothetical protein [Tanacetum cinerariifolium]